MQSGKLRLIRQIQSLLQKQIPQRSLFNQIDKLKKHAVQQWRHIC